MRVFVNMFSNASGAFQQWNQNQKRTNSTFPGVRVPGGSFADRSDSDGEAKSIKIISSG